MLNPEISSTATGLVTSWRYVPPAHYTLKVDSFSLFLSNNIDHYESRTFESCGYTWKLSLYPNGNKKKNVIDHLSLYLVIADADTLPCNWEVNITFKFFLYNHVSDEYLTFQDVQNVTTRLYKMKNEVGFDKLFPLADLKDPSNGLLLDDSCIFGAEVFVIKYNGIGECISMIKNPLNNTFAWEIPNFLQRPEKFIFSEEFVIGDHKWKLVLYPKGYTTSVTKDGSISLYLELVDDLLSSGKVLAKFKLRVKNNGKKQVECLPPLEHWFCNSCKSWGYSNFFSLEDFKKQSEPNGALTVEAQMKLMSKHKDF